MILSSLMGGCPKDLGTTNSARDRMVNEVFAQPIAQSQSTLLSESTVRQYEGADRSDMHSSNRLLVH